MKIVKFPAQTAKPQISHIEITTDCLADRGGLAPLMRYTQKTGIIDALADRLAGFRQRRNGLPVRDLISQIFAFLYDGTSRHLSYFDHLKQDQGYLALLECSPKEAASSHQIKRFFSKFSKVRSSSFRKMLRSGFAQRLREEQPKEVVLFLDTMVLDNDDALCRQAASPTYKKVKGFQPLHLIWDGLFVDVQFRGGKKNGNHGLTASRMIDKAAAIVREVLGYEVPIVVRMDSGFFDGELFWRLDINSIGFVCGGRQTQEIKQVIETQSSEYWSTFDNGRQRWSYTEFGMRCKSWDRFYRAIYLKAAYEDDQKVFDFARRDQILITNMGPRRNLFARVADETREALLEAERLITEYHAKGQDELTHRGIKDFGFEALPFKGYGANAALYYLMVIAYNVMTWYKRDILPDKLGRHSYPTTLRRRFIDFAAKIVRTGGKTILKVTQATMDRTGLEDIWERCNRRRAFLW